MLWPFFLSWARIAGLTTNTWQMGHFWIPETHLLELSSGTRAEKVIQGERARNWFGSISLKHHFCIKRKKERTKENHVLIICAKTFYKQTLGDETRSVIESKWHCYYVLEIVFGTHAEIMLMPTDWVKNKRGPCLSSAKLFREEKKKVRER